MNDSDLSYIQRVLESHAPDEDRERAAQMVRDIRRSYGQAPAASPDFPHYEMAFICRVLEGDHPEKADLDTALGMARSVRVALLKERAAQAPAASVEPGDEVRNAALPSDMAHEIWAAAQLSPGEGIVDGAARVEALLPRYGQAPAASVEPPYEIDALFDALSNLEHDNYERSYSGSKNREADAGLIRAALERYAAPVAASAKPVAYRVLRKAHDGEWKDDGRDWCNGKPSADLLADIAKRADSWRIECAYATPVAAQAPRPCTCHPDDRPDGPCREKYAASECQAPAANGDAPTARELDMAMLVKRLARTVKASDPAMHGAALDALKRWGLAGSPLREGGE